MPRKKRASVKKILRERLEEPETARKFAEALLSTLNLSPEKVKPGDALKILDFAVEGQAAPESVEGPDPSEDLSRYTDAELWDWLRRLEGGKARGP